MTTVFAILDGQGDPVALTPGEGFVTHWLTIADAEEAETHGAPIGQRIAFEVSHPWTALDSYGAEDLARFCITRALLVSDDSGETVTGFSLSSVGGVAHVEAKLSPIDLSALRQAKRTEVSAQFAARATAPIEFAAGGVVKTWDADGDAVVNISGIVLMIAAGVAVPNPRPWTAHGELTPTALSHADLVGLGAAIAARKDALFVRKMALAAQLEGLTDPALIDAFDPTAGWT